MEARFRYIILFVIVLMMGCKTKHKLIKTDEEKVTVKTNTVDTSSVKKVDSTKTTVEVKKETTKKNTLELTFELDPKKFATDSDGVSKNDTTDFELNKLINKALRYSSSLKIKIEKSISESDQQKETIQNNLKEEASTRKISTGESVAFKKSAETKIDKEPPKATFWGTVKTAIIWGVLITGLIVFILYRFKK